MGVTCICGVWLGAPYDSFLDLDIFKCLSMYMIIFKIQGVQLKSGPSTKP